MAIYAQRILFGQLLPVLHFNLQPGCFPQPPCLCGFYLFRLPKRQKQTGQEEQTLPWPTGSGGSGGR